MQVLSSYKNDFIYPIIENTLEFANVPYALLTDHKKYLKKHATTLKFDRPTSSEAKFFLLFIIIIFFSWCIFKIFN